MISNKKFLLSIVLASLFASMGCGGGQAVAIDLSTGGEDEPLLDEKIEKEAATPVAPPGTIFRKDLNEVLASGPASVLALITTEPVRSSGQFVGFKISGFTQGAPQSIDLQVGDVILAVNGRKIERPEHYFEIFEELRVASELRFDLQRDGTKKTLSYAVIETGGSPTMSR
jgi:type II secretory pathway component PulC